MEPPQPVRPGGFFMPLLLSLAPTLTENTPMPALTKADKTQLPYTLLLDPETGNAAAYSATNKLITAHASKELIAFALVNVKQDLPFDVEGHAATPTRRPPPAWATPEIQARMRLIWLERPHQDAYDEAWLAIPAK